MSTITRSLRHSRWTNRREVTTLSGYRAPIYKWSWIILTGLTLLATAPVLTAQLLSVEGQVDSVDPFTGEFSIDHKTSSLVDVPTFVACAVPWVEGRAYAAYGLNQVYYHLTGPHYPGAGGGEYPGYSDAGFGSSWKDIFTISGVSGWSYAAFVFDWTAFRDNSTVWISVNGGPQWRLGTGNGRVVYDQRFSSGVPFEFEASAGAWGGLYGPNIGGVWPQNPNVELRLRHIVLPPGASLIAASAHGHSASSTVSQPVISVSSSNTVEIRWFNSPAIPVARVETTTNLLDSASWVDAGAPVASEGYEYSVSVQKDGPSRFFRLRGPNP